MTSETQRKWGVDTYAKWDNFDDEEDDGERKEDVDKVGARAMQFNLGENKLKVKNVEFAVTKPGQDKLIKNLKQAETDVWQVVIRKLRVWSAASTGADEGANAIPCRPHSIFISQLYPVGKMLFQTICDPPETYPDAQTILDCLAECMLNPLAGEQRRPKAVTFPDAEMAGSLYKTLEKWKVEASELSESQGIDEMVKKYSEMMVEKDFASIGTTSESPGLLSVSGVSNKLVQSVFQTCAKFGRVQPWQKIQERMAFELRITNPAFSVIEDVESSKMESVQPNRLWVAVLGYDSRLSGNIAGGTFGVVMFYSLLDMQARLVPEGEELFILPTQDEPKCSYSGKTKSELGRDLKRTKPPKVDIRTGEELMYADADALRKHWPSVRKFAIEKSELEKGRKERRQHWLGKECTMLFEEPTLLPFDDLDAIDNLGLEIVEPNENLDVRFQRYPVLLEFTNGNPSRPSGAQLAWLELAMQAILNHPDPTNKKESKKVKFHSNSIVPGDMEMEIIPTPIHFVSEAKLAMEAKQKQQRVTETVEKDEEEEKEAASPQPKDPEPEQRENIDHTEQEPGKDEKNCTIS